MNLCGIVISFTFTLIFTISGTLFLHVNPMSISYHIISASNISLSISCKISLVQRIFSISLCLNSILLSSLKGIFTGYRFLIDIFFLAFSTSNTPLSPNLHYFWPEVCFTLTFVPLFVMFLSSLAAPEIVMFYFQQFDRNAPGGGDGGGTVCVYPASGSLGFWIFGLLFINFRKVLTIISSNSSSFLILRLQLHIY